MTASEGALSVDGLVKAYAGVEGGVRAVDGVSFTIEEGKFYTLLGPSGCGKSTTLRCIAGLERTDAGRISLGGRVVSSHEPRVFVRPDERDLGMVFQSYAIWPHMTVFDNVAFPLRAVRASRRGIPRSAIRERVLSVLEKVQLTGFEDRMATKLSGGQQQRLALARALARDPKLLLLDEPLSNLDAGLRERMRTELRRLQRTFGVTTLYVTHDQSEALSMSNRVAVMEDGRIVQEASPRDIYRKPGTKFVATFVGRTNLLDARVVGRGDGGALRLDTDAGTVQAVCPEGTAHNEQASLSIRPEDVRLHRERPPDNTANVLEGRVEYVLFLGESVEYHVSVGKELLISRQHPDVELRRRSDVFVELPVHHCIVVSDEHGSTQPPAGGDPPLPDAEEPARATLLAPPAGPLPPMGLGAPPTP
jgi:iron(III) transport system ATP-binding protein